MVLLTCMFPNLAPGVIPLTLSGLSVACGVVSSRPDLPGGRLLGGVGGQWEGWRLKVKYQRFAMGFNAQHCKG